MYIHAEAFSFVLKVPTTCGHHWDECVLAPPHPHLLPKESIAWKSDETTYLVYLCMLAFQAIRLSVVLPVVQTYKMEKDPRGKNGNQTALPHKTGRVPEDPRSRS